MKMIKKDKNFWAVVVVIVLLVVVVVIEGVIIGRLTTKDDKTDSDTVKLSFQDIGELATQSSYSKEVNVTKDSKNFFGIDLPFTQTQYIYSYGVEIKAGYDFSKINWERKGDTIEVSLPEASILSTEIDPDSFKVYYEEESIFTPISIADDNDALKKLKKTAEEDAVASGLLEIAKENAKVVLENFIYQTYDRSEYHVEFIE